MTNSTDQAGSWSDKNGKFIYMGGGLLFAGAAALSFFALQSSSSTETPDVDSAVSAAGISDAQRTAMEAIVRDYILTHPEIIPEAVEILQTRESAKRINAVRKQAETPFGNGWAGNENGDVVLVEFSDYACGYCRQSREDVERLIKEDPNLKVVFRELPILSDASNDAALMALAAAKQGKFMEFHRAMFSGARPNDSSINVAAKKAGVNLKKAEAFIASDEGKAEIESNLNMARTMQFTGTPAWIIGNQSMVGAVGYDGLKEAIAKAREAK